MERNTGSTRGISNCEEIERFREKTHRPAKGTLLVENAPKTPLGRTLRAGNFNGRRTSNGMLVGIHDALAAVAPFMKRTKGY